MFVVSELAAGILKKDRTALARAITLVESSLPEHVRQTRELFRSLQEGHHARSSSSLRIGISGSPGVGKSSLIDRLGMYCILKEGLTVATLAVDPSSKRSGGSILGDKARMMELSNDFRAFVRPSPSGGELGGVTRGTFSSINLCEEAGFDVIFVESVGVGQSEMRLADLTDLFVLCAAPGAGDDLQAMKRGINEMADLILLNKAEEPMTGDARRALMELRAAQTFRLRPSPVLAVSAMKNQGIEAVWSTIKCLESESRRTGEFDTRRTKQKFKWFETVLRNDLLERFENDTMSRSRIDQLKTCDESFVNLLNKSEELIHDFLHDHK